MRPIVFSASPLRQFLRRKRIATLPELKQVLGTEAVTTAEALVNQAPAGYFAAEMEELVHVPVKEPLLQLVRHGICQ